MCIRDRCRGFEAGSDCGTITDRARAGAGALLRPTASFADAGAFQQRAARPDALGAAARASRRGRGGVRSVGAVSYTHLRAHETVLDIVCRLLLEKKKLLTSA